MNNKKYLIILGIGILIILLIYVCIPNTKQEMSNINKQVSTGNIMSLLKDCVDCLNSSPTLEENSFTEEAMVKFAKSYLQRQSKSNMEYTMDPDFAIADISLIKDTVKYIFDREIDMSKLTYEIKDGKIYIPTVLTGGDAYIFKYKSKEYNKETDTYVIHIDCLNANGERMDELFKDSTVTYDISEIMFTMQIKYRIKDDRYVFLAYNSEMVGNE